MKVELNRAEAVFLKAWGSEKTPEQCAQHLHRSVDFILAAADQLGITLAKPKAKPVEKPVDVAPVNAPIPQPAAASAVQIPQPVLPQPKVAPPPQRAPEKLVNRVGRKGWSTWTEGQDRLLRELYPEHTNGTIAVRLGKPRHAVEKRAQELRLRKPEGFVRSFTKIPDNPMVAVIKQARELMKQGERGKAFMLLDGAIKKAR